MNINCCYCECELNKENLTKEHIVPISQGGNNLLFNLRACCKTCNRLRGSDPLFVFRFKVKRYMDRNKIPNNLNEYRCKEIIKNTYIIEKYINENLDLLL